MVIIYEISAILYLIAIAILSIVAGLNFLEFIGTMAIALTCTVMVGMGLDHLKRLFGDEQ